MSTYADSASAAAAAAPVRWRGLTAPAAAADDALIESKLPVESELPGPGDEEWSSVAAAAAAAVRSRSRSLDAVTQVELESNN
jgi:hypothetical protein